MPVSCAREVGKEESVRDRFSGVLRLLESSSTRSGFLSERIVRLLTASVGNQCARLSWRKKRDGRVRFCTGDGVLPARLPSSRGEPSRIELTLSRDFCFRSFLSTADSHEDNVMPDIPDIWDASLRKEAGRDENGDLKGASQED